MRRLYVGLCVVLCALTAATVAGAATKTIKSSGSFQARLLEQNGKGEGVFTGLISDKKYGHGAVVVVNKASGNTLTGTFQAFFPRGMVSGTATDTITANPDGSVTHSNGKLTVKRGFGSFKGYSGTGAYSGTGVREDCPE